MNWIILYILSFFAILIVLTVGYFMNKQSVACFKHYQNKENKKGIISKELALQLFKQNRLKGTALTTLKAKKSNYFSAKYNVIKLSPETINSPYLFDLAICAKCANHAKTQQYKYISSALKYIVSIISKFISIMIIPIILISSILNISGGLNKIAFTISLIALIIYVVMFIIEYILYISNQLSSQKISLDLENTGFFDHEETTALLDLITALNKFDFFSFTRLCFNMFLFTNPAYVVK